MFNRIRNAQAVSRPTVVIPFAKIKYEIARILEKKGFVEKVKLRGKGQKRIIRVILKYSGEGKPYITRLKRISKPGQRIYWSHQEIRKARRRRKTAIISTSSGVMTDEEADWKKTGGEVLCEVW